MIVQCLLHRVFPSSRVERTSSSFGERDIILEILAAPNSGGGELIVHPKHHLSKLFLTCSATLSEPPAIRVIQASQSMYVSQHRGKFEHLPCEDARRPSPCGKQDVWDTLFSRCDDPLALARMHVVSTASEVYPFLSTELGWYLKVGSPARITARPPYRTEASKKMEVPHRSCGKSCASLRSSLPPPNTFTTVERRPHSPDRCIGQRIITRAASHRVA